MGFKRKFIKDAVQALKDVANDTPAGQAKKKIKNNAFFDAFKAMEDYYDIPQETQREHEKKELLGFNRKSNKKPPSMDIKGQSSSMG